MHAPYHIPQSIKCRDLHISCLLTRGAWLTDTDAAYTLRINGALLGTAGTQLAQLAAELRRTDALESYDLVYTGAAIEALLSLATDGLVADISMPAIEALARVRAIRIEAMSIIQTGHSLLALIDVRLTEGARVTGAAAVTTEAIAAIRATAIVLAWLRSALIHIDLAPCATVSLPALTYGTGTTGQHNAGAVIHARIGLAKRMHVHLGFAVIPTVIRIAQALIVTAWTLATCAAIVTWSLSARRAIILLTVLPRVSCRAAALIAFGVGGTSAMTHARIIKAIVILRPCECLLFTA